MKSNSIDLKFLDENKLEKAAIVLKKGGVIIHPTETVYGLAAVWNNENAIRRVAQLKKRSIEKPFSILVNKIEQIFNISGWQSNKLRNLLEDVFPAPITILLPRKLDLPVLFWNQFVAIGFRFSDFQLCEKLVSMVGAPLITTSANVSDQPPPKSSMDVSKSLANDVDLVLDGGESPIQIPSTVLRFNPENLDVELIREGAYPFHEFQKKVNAIFGNLTC